tara:strand:- start:41 stop:259 length:219 start_codon:yes stop_codon:yes gene_type:complete
MDEQKALEERRIHNQIMFAYRKAIDNIIKKGREPGAALKRMYELQERRNKERILRKEMKKAVRMLNGAAKRQ